VSQVRARNSNDRWHSSISISISIAYAQKENVARQSLDGSDEERLQALAVDELSVGLVLDELVERCAVAGALGLDTIRDTSDRRVVTVDVPLVASNELGLQRSSTMSELQHPRSLLLVEIESIR